MTLSLDQNQRLQLIAIFDGLECTGRRETWAVCALQSKLELSDEERQEINLRALSGSDRRTYLVWDNNGAIRVREFEFAADDVGRICRALDGYRVVLGRDRAWWEPLTAQLPEPEANGNKP